MIMTGAIRQSLLLVDSLVEWHDRKYGLYCLLRPTISNIFMIILLTNCAAIKKGNCCQKLGIRSGRPRKTHAILRLARCPVSMGFPATFQNSPQLPRIHLKIGLKHVVSYLRIIYLL